MKKDGLRCLAKTLPVPDRHEKLRTRVTRTQVRTQRRGSLRSTGIHLLDRPCVVIRMRLFMSVVLLKVPTRSIVKLPFLRSRDVSSDLYPQTRRVFSARFHRVPLVLTSL